MPGCGNLPFWVFISILAFATSCGSEKTKGEIGGGFSESDGAEHANAATAYVGATLIDVANATPIPNSAVIVVDDRIVGVGTRETLPAAENLRQVDLRGHWLIPGLIDAHVHFFESGRIYTKPRQIDLTRIVSYDEEASWIRKRAPYTLSRYLCAGVTTAISMGGPSLEFEFREIAKRQADAPNVLVAAGPLTLVAPEAILPKFEGEHVTRQIGAPPTIRDEIRRAVDLQSDLIKTAHLGHPFQQAEREYSPVHARIAALLRRFLHERESIRA
ncbi:MAG: hypothetical protein AAFY56_16580, partial [Pseudomonadota bacterium]